MKHIDPLSYADPGAGAIAFDRGNRTVMLVTTSRYDDADAIARIRSALPGSEIVTLSQRSPVSTPAVLTDRQREILHHLLDGLSNKEIARQLGLSHFTVRNHVSNILRLMGYNCRRTMRHSLAGAPARAADPPRLVA
jgi:DNA-binding NarL/FixJ family response regulator